MTDNPRCKSMHYGRDNRYYQCDLDKEHQGQHEHRVLMWWSDDV